jgi:ABC-2 type transport system permease protein
MSVVARDNVRILGYAFGSGVADWRAMFTLRTWLLGWLGRLLAQATLFALIGRYVGTQDTVTFLVIGNGVLVLAQSVLFSIPTTAWERPGGTYALLIAAPGSLFAAFYGRSALWVLDGTTCSLISLLLLGPLFGAEPPMPGALVILPLVFVTAWSVYAYGLVVGALMLEAVQLRVLASNISIFLLMLFTGVQVPTSFWPRPVEVVSNVVPMTHGLRSVRNVFDGAGAGPVLTEIALEAAVGSVWLLLAFALFRILAERARRIGTVEFGG